MKKSYWLYILSSKSGTLYVGVTNNLAKRVFQHKHGLIKGFSKKYSCKDLVYFEEYQDVSLAIAREKQIKNWRREKKENIIRNLNPSWKDLSLNIA